MKTNGALAPNGTHATKEPDYSQAVAESDQFKSAFIIPRKPISRAISDDDLDDAARHEREQLYPEKSSQEEASRATHRLIYGVFRNWWLESLACLVFLVALTAIVATLYPHQDQPLPQWPYSLSINTLVAVYVAILKGAILLVTAEGLSQMKWAWFRRKRPLEDLASYDMASRGPWVSLCSSM